jgi:hypothetical protein
MSFLSRTNSPKMINSILKKTLSGAPKGRWQETTPDNKKGLTE